MIVGLCSICGRRNLGSVAGGVFVCIACTGPQGGPGEPETDVEPELDREAA
jgi:hypothetical protein